MAERKEAGLKTEVKKKKRDEERGNEGGAREGDAHERDNSVRMLRASPFCLNAVYAVARQQPLRSIHI